MPTARGSRTIRADPDELWELVSDPHHLPRWWPRVTRVEGVAEGAFTQVMKTSKGRTVRADFDVAADPPRRALRWSQQVAGTPFAHVLSASETELTLCPADGRQTEVTIELRQTLAGFFPRFGSYMVRRAAAATILAALDGLERISG